MANGHTVTIFRPRIMNFILHWSHSPSMTSLAISVRRTDFVFIHLKVMMKAWLSSSKKPHADLLVGSKVTVIRIELAIALRVVTGADMGVDP